ncbi:MAG TPA: ABC-F family ATP-binding cassette domain-containing protein [Methyloceanibacter sp.]|jgi:ATP-binding cassette subfamily F protein 3|nr:ABC-F family ATP-binding cassette domain-containing protein [Methyloceanibacter sp.]
MLVVDGVSLRLGGHLILDHASASLPPRARVGLVGRNGAGKSTLLKLIAGMYETDEGRIEAPSGTRIGYLAQEAPGGEATPFEAVLAAATERAELLAEAEHVDDPHRIAEIHERLNAIDAHGAPARASRILAGLGFTEEAQHRPLSSFSGGWRMRVALAALLFSEPDLLLLDEPSNHLDLEAALWLESFLKSYRRSLIVVSHERDLLNNVVDYILHLERGRLTLYPGNYDAFARLRHERRAQAEATRAQQEARAKKLKAYVDRWRYKAHTARQAQSRLKALDRMQPIEAVVEDTSIAFDFPSPKELRPPLIVLEDASVGYVPGKPILSRLNLRIDPDDRLALVGRNGNGKTTLARLLAGQLKPMTGTIAASSKLQVGYFAQHQIEELVPDETPFQHMERLLPGAKPGDVRAQLGRFGFSGDKANLAVRQLSGGERARLSLALITRDAPHILILDEPTNHLDVDARDALVKALTQFGGAVVVVSHDRHLLGLIADRLVLVDNGTAKEFDGSLDDYRDLVLGEKRTEERARSSPQADRKEARRLAAEASELAKAARKLAATAEAELKLLWKRRDEIDAALASPQSNGGKPVGELLKARAEVERQVVAAEQRWLEASEAAEQAKAG